MLMRGNRKRGYTNMSKLGREKLKLFNRYEELTRYRSDKNLERVIDQLVKVKEMVRNETKSKN